MEAELEVLNLEAAREELARLQEINEARDARIARLEREAGELWEALAPFAKLGAELPEMYPGFYLLEHKCSWPRADEFRRAAAALGLIGEGCGRGARAETKEPAEAGTTNPRPGEIVAALWEGAAARMTRLREAYEELGGAGAPALFIALRPLWRRYEAGERSEELWTAIMELA